MHGQFVLESKIQSQLETLEPAVRRQTATPITRFKYRVQSLARPSRIEIPEMPTYLLESHSNSI